jgi:hypothetical protein
VKGPGRDDVLVEKKRDDILRKKAYLMSYHVVPYNAIRGSCR